MVVFTVPVLLSMVLSDFFTMLTTLAVIIFDAQEEKCHFLWSVCSVVFLVNAIVVTIKFVIYIQQINDLKKLNVLLRRPLFKILYAINIMIFLSICSAEILNYNCPAKIELYSLMFFTSLTLIQPFVLITVL